MPSRDRVAPVTMSRVAVVAPTGCLRETLTRLADEGVVEVEIVPAPDALPGPAARVLQRMGGAGVTAALLAAAPDLTELERVGRADLVAGEAALERVAGSTVANRHATALAGWVPSEAVAGLAHRLGEVGGAVVRLPRPRGSQPPTLLRRRRSSAQPFTTLVETYSVVPYADVDPTPFAAAAYVLMFGMMFGDVGEGSLLVLLALLARLGRPGVLARLGPASSMLAALGVASVLAGAAYGEFFGPTGVVPPLWKSPMSDPVGLLLSALVIGAGLLGLAFCLGTVNRVREGGWAYALYSPSGLAGATLFLGGAGLVAGLLTGADWLVLVACLVVAGGLVLSFTGLYVAAGRGGQAVVEALVELFDLVIRLGSNVVSFARLAAFGLTHAAIGAIVWAGTTALWGRGGAAYVGAVLVFVLGTAVAFLLEALVAAVQALRLEYYELFSRVFQGEGRPYRPWHVPLVLQPTSAVPGQEVAP
ncbi:MAG: V-type ATPase 116kDa subunit family protein [Oryzihumus sp.]